MKKEEKATIQVSSDDYGSDYDSFEDPKEEEETPKATLPVRVAS